MKPLEFSQDWYRSDNQDINNFLERYGVIKIEPWLISATDKDFDGEIYLNRIYRITFSEKTKNTILNAMEELKSIAGVQYVERENRHKIYYTPNDSQYGQQWFLPAINSNDAWDLWDVNGGEIPGDKQIILASVDTGVNWKHPDLVYNIYQNLGEDADGDGQTIIYSGGQWILDPGDLNGIDDDNWDNNASTYIDDLVGWEVSGGTYGDNNPNPPGSGGWSHGTHVAGLLSATSNNSTGIASTAFNCSILPVKCTADNEDNNYISNGYEGMFYAAQAGYNAEGFVIINCSWGGMGSNIFEQANINTMYNNYNAVIFAASGNGSETGWGEDYSAHFPSSYDHVISVTALGQNKSWNHWATYHETVDLGSPGESIRSTTISNYQSWDGTSMASPVAASCAGLLKSFNPSWDNEKIEMMLLETADPAIYSVNSESYLQGRLGRGQIDMLKAITTPLFPKLEIAAEDIIIVDDNDGEINIGETVEYRIVIFNDPEWGTATNAELTLSTQSSGITFSNNNVSLGNIPPGDVGLNEGSPIIIEFNDSAQIGDVEIVASITSNEDNYIQYEVNLPFTLSINEIQINIGDITNDGEIDVLDIVTIVNIVLDAVNPTNYQSIAADMNVDGVINVQDIVLLVNLVLSN
tara:strand:+ start:611 stop:2524 length:1914 start_codon:yes stop_codon:yes gene_type:complete